MHLLIHRNHPWQHRNLRSQYWEGDFCEYLLQNRYRQTTKLHNKLTSGTELLKKLPRSITKQQVPHLVRRPTAYRKLEAEEWKGLSLDESAFDIDRSEADAMAAVKVVDSDDEPPCGSFTGQLLSSNPISVVSKRTLCRNPTRSPKYRLVLCLLWRLYLRPSSAPAALFSRLSYSHRNSCRIDSTPNKAWAKLSGLPARKIGRCERGLGDALEWRLWVGKTPAGSSASSPTSNRAVVGSQSDGQLFTSSR